VVLWWLFSTPSWQFSWYSLIVTLVSRKAFLKRLQHSAVLIDRVFGVLLIVLALNVLLRALLQI